MLLLLAWWLAFYKQYFSTDDLTVDSETLKKQNDESKINSVPTDEEQNLEPQVEYLKNNGLLEDNILLKNNDKHDNKDEFTIVASVVDELECFEEVDLDCTGYQSDDFLEQDDVRHARLSYQSNFKSNIADQQQIDCDEEDNEVESLLRGITKKEDTMKYHTTNGTTVTLSNESIGKIHSIIIRDEEQPQVRVSVTPLAPTNVHISHPTSVHVTRPTSVHVTQQHPGESTVHITQEAKVRACSPRFQVENNGPQILSINQDEITDDGEQVVRLNLESPADNDLPKPNPPAAKTPPKNFNQHLEALMKPQVVEEVVPVMQACNVQSVNDELPPWEEIEEELPPPPTTVDDKQATPPVLKIASSNITPPTPTTPGKLEMAEGEKHDGKAGRQVGKLEQKPFNVKAPQQFEKVQAELNDFEKIMKRRKKQVDTMDDAATFLGQLSNRDAKLYGDRKLSPGWKILKDAVRKKKYLDIKARAVTKSTLS